MKDSFVSAYTKTHVHADVLELTDVEDTTAEELNGILQAMCIRRPKNGLLYFAGAQTLSILRKRLLELTPDTRNLLKQTGIRMGHKNEWLFGMFEPHAVFHDSNEEIPPR
jgi:hypothetical protein